MMRNLMFVWYSLHQHFYSLPKSHRLCSFTQPFIRATTWFIEDTSLHQHFYPLPKSHRLRSFTQPFIRAATWLIEDTIAPDYQFEFVMTRILSIILTYFHLLKYMVCHCIHKLSQKAVYSILLSSIEVHGMSLYSLIF